MEPEKKFRVLKIYMHIDSEITGRTVHQLEVESVFLPDAFDEIWKALGLNSIFIGGNLVDYSNAGDLFPPVFWALDKLIRSPEKYQDVLSDDPETRFLQLGGAIRKLSAICTACWLYPKAKLAMKLEANKE